MSTRRNVLQMIAMFRAREKLDLTSSVRSLSVEKAVESRWKLREPSQGGKPLQTKANQT